MAKTSVPHPQRGLRPSLPQVQHRSDLAPNVVRLANRTASLTFLAAFLSVLGLVLLLRTLEGGSIPARLAAALPLLCAVGAILYVRRL